MHMIKIGPPVYAISGRGLSERDLVLLISISSRVLLLYYFTDNTSNNCHRDEEVIVTSRYNTYCIIS